MYNVHANPTINVQCTMYMLTLQSMYLHGRIQLHGMLGQVVTCDHLSDQEFLLDKYMLMYGLSEFKCC